MIKYVRKKVVVNKLEVDKQIEKIINKYKKNRETSQTCDFVCDTPDPTTCPCGEANCSFFNPEEEDPLLHCTCPQFDYPTCNPD